MEYCANCFILFHPNWSDRRAIWLLESKIFYENPKGSSFHDSVIHSVILFYFFFRKSIYQIEEKNIFSVILWFTWDSSDYYSTILNNYMCLIWLLLQNNLLSCWYKVNPSGIIVVKHLIFTKISFWPREAAVKHLKLIEFIFF